MNLRPLAALVLASTACCSAPPDSGEQISDFAIERGFQRFERPPELAPVAETRIDDSGRFYWNSRQIEIEDLKRIGPEVYRFSPRPVIRLKLGRDAEIAATRETIDALSTEFACGDEFGCFFEITD